MLQDYITSLILKYARTYIRGIQANVNLSVWGGDLVLDNLDLRLDVIQQKLKLPAQFVFTRGFIKQLSVFLSLVVLSHSE